MAVIAFISPNFDLRPLAARLSASVPGSRIAVWPEDDIAQAEVAVCWMPPAGIYARMPALRLIHSVAAGADNLLSGHDTRGVPVCRIVDPGQARGMLEYVSWAVLHFHRRFDLAQRNQPDRRWLREPAGPASSWRVGVMGLGAIGAHTACGLAAQGYEVAGWARTKRELPGVRVYAGASSLPAFLGRTDTLVCLLPLTPETHGLLDRKLFEALPAQASLVHAGRGPQLVESDLLQAVRSGRLRGAVLDVFQQEPLPSTHPFWTEPGIWVTPHMATMADIEQVRAQIQENLRRLASGEALLNRVDAGRGY